MAGLYIHIPFCEKKCGYCDFYSITKLQHVENYVSSLCKEITNRKNELTGEKIKTVYFGGGTPSLLSINNLDAIINTIHKHYNTSETEELTIEVNPDDITKEYLQGLLSLGFNRLSIGVQSFNNEALKLMNRRHDAQQAKNAVYLAHDNGFENLSIDLIYALPNLQLLEWESTLKQAIELNANHISAYHLTFEKNTAFYEKLKNNKLKETDEALSVEQYNMLIKMLSTNGFYDYEISNFCKLGFESKHNSNYWTGNAYLGFGTSAHSYNGKARSWNIASVNDYIKIINNGELAYETEILSDIDIYNETIMLGLRTAKGVNINTIQNMNNNIVSIFNKQRKNNITLQNVIEQNGYLKVCADKKMLTDQIISDFFIA